MKMQLTAAMKKMLIEIDKGTDPNIMAQVTQIMGKRQALACSRTLLALYRRGALRIAKGGGLEITDEGRAAARR